MLWAASANMDLVFTTKTGDFPMKPKEELRLIIDQIASADSPVGMDAVYVHALILDKLNNLSKRIARLEKMVSSGSEDSR